MPPPLVRPLFTAPSAVPGGLTRSGAEAPCAPQRHHLGHRATGPDRPPPAPSAGLRTPSCAVVVDDDVDTAEVFADVLRDLGLEALTAHDGATGTALILARAPDLVLLDIDLPRRSGLEVVRTLRGVAALAGAYAVAISGHARAADRQRALEAGFDDHLVKPIDVATLTRLAATARPVGHA